jgi:hypothetical protein
MRRVEHEDRAVHRRAESLPYEVGAAREVGPRRILKPDVGAVAVLCGPICCADEPSPYALGRRCDGDFVARIDAGILRLKSLRPFHGSLG